MRAAFQSPFQSIFAARESCCCEPPGLTWEWKGSQFSLKQRWVWRQGHTRWPCPRVSPAPAHICGGSAWEADNYPRFGFLWLWHLQGPDAPRPPGEQGAALSQNQEWPPAEAVSETAARWAGSGHRVYPARHRLLSVCLISDQLSIFSFLSPSHMESHGPTSSCLAISRVASRPVGGQPWTQRPAPTSLGQNLLAPPPQRRCGQGSLLTDRSGWRACFAAMRLSVLSVFPS